MAGVRHRRDWRNDGRFVAEREFQMDFESTLTSNIVLELCC